MGCGSTTGEERQFATHRCRNLRSSNVRFEPSTWARDASVRIYPARGHEVPMELGAIRNCCRNSLRPRCGAATCQHALRDIVVRRGEPGDCVSALARRGTGRWICPGTAGHAPRPHGRAPPRITIQLGQTHDFPSCSSSALGSGNAKRHIIPLFPSCRLMARLLRFSWTA